MEYYFVITNASAWLVLGIQAALLLYTKVPTCPNQENHPQVQPLKSQHLILNVNQSLKPQAYTSAVSVLFLRSVCGTYEEIINRCTLVSSDL